jgi:hypothetical protein
VRTIIREVCCDVETKLSMAMSEVFLFTGEALGQSDVRMMISV